MKRHMLCGALVLLLMASARPASAMVIPLYSDSVTIGSFDYTLDPTWGPTFTITNDALFTLGDPTAAFLSGTIHIFDNNVGVDTLSFGRIDAGDSLRLSPFDYDQPQVNLTQLVSGSARLDLLFALEGAVGPVSLNGLTFSTDSDGFYTGTFIDPDFTGRPITYTPVPEPASGLLLCLGVLALVAAGRARLKQPS